MGYSFDSSSGESESRDRILTGNPRVTFLILTRNQERFIAEAIDSALAQDYDALEIIVSDDCSTDGTWQIVNEKLGADSSPHEITIRREPRTVGTLAHLLRAVEGASGELIILAAGDDISYSTRTRRLAECWMHTGAAAFSSRHDTVDENGNCLKRDLAGIAGAQVRRWLGVRDARPLVKGCTSAYTLSFLRSIPVPGNTVLHEDIAASLWLIGEGRDCARVERSLVAYRRHDDSVSSRSPGVQFNKILAELRHECLKLRQYIELYTYLLDRQVPEFKDPQMRQRAQDEIFRAREACLVRIQCMESGFLGRIVLCRRAQGVGQLGYLLRRLFGLRFLAFQKLMWRLVLKLSPARERRP